MIPPDRANKYRYPSLARDWFFPSVAGKRVSDNRVSRLNEATFVHSGAFK